MTLEVRLALVIAAVAAAVASIGDLLLLWVAGATRPELSLPSPPAWALGAGGVAGVLAIPFYGLGYGALARPVSASRPYVAACIRGGGVCAAGFGAAIHGITGLVLAAERTLTGAVIEPLELVERWGRLLLPLWAVATVLVVLASGLWARAAWRGQAGVPRWAAWANPVVGTVVLAGVATVTPLARALLLPAAPNLAHALFFALTAGFLRR